MKNYLNVKLSPKKRAELLLGEMSLDEKIAQINCYYFFDGRDDEALKDGIGTISCLEFRGHGRKYTVEKIRELQEKVIKNSPHSIPAIFHMEGLSGLLTDDASCFPSGIARGATFDDELEREIGKTVGDEAAELSITHVFAPVLDITRDARFGRTYESYSEDETLVARMGTAYSEGVQDNCGREVNVEGVAKHFLGFHKSSGGLHGTDVVVSERELKEVYAKPFEAAFRKAHLRGVMPCYNFINGEFTSYSKRILTELLRDELGFDGLTASDYCAIQNGVEVNRIAKDKAEAGVRALNAGMDIEQHIPYGYGDELKEKFISREVDISILDRAVLRVLEAKFRMGLFERPYTNESEKPRYKDDALSYRAATESIVLLKNNGVLPLKQDYKKIAVIGYHAATNRGMFAGYTNYSMYEGLLGYKNTMAGLASAKDTEEERYKGTNVYKEDNYTELYEREFKRMFPQSRTLLEELKATFPKSEIVYAKGYDFVGDDESGFEEALQACKGADLIILTLGGKCGTGARCSMGENINSTDVNLPAVQEKFIRHAYSLHIPLVGVHFDGRPISSDAADECLDGLLECWNPSQYGAKSVADILTGKATPSGKLPVTVARNAGQLPIYYSQPFGSSYHVNEAYADTSYANCSITPRYYFGYGMSYTKFAYSAFKIERSGDDLTVTCKIKNAGEYDGTEIVQLYFTVPVATVARPSLSLIGFARVPLKQGDEKTVEFKFDTSSFAFLDENMKWKIEKGEIILKLASSSEEIKYQEAICIEEDKFIEGKNRCFYADKQVI